MKNKEITYNYFQSLTKNKDKAVNYFITNTLNKTQSMFFYKNLPVTIPQNELESLLQRNGFAFFTKVENDFFVFDGGLGGQLDMYYRPTKITVANPFLNLSKMLSALSFSSRFFLLLEEPLDLSDLRFLFLLLPNFLLIT